MRRSFYELYIHVIWTTKNKERLVDEKIESTIRSIIKEKCKKFNVELIAIGNTEDHLHLLLSIHPGIKVLELVAEIKGSTSHFIKHQINNNFYWQDGYGVLSVSKSGLEFVKKYIEEQRQHHMGKNNLVPILEKTCVSPIHGG